MEITRNLPVFDTPSGMGGKFTVAIVEELDAQAVRVRVCYGTFRGGEQWEAWKDWDGYTFQTTRDKLTNPRKLGEPRTNVRA